MIESQERHIDFQSEVAMKRRSDAARLDVGATTDVAHCPEEGSPPENAM